MDASEAVDPAPHPVPSPSVRASVQKSTNYRDLMAKYNDLKSKYQKLTMERNDEMTRHQAHERRDSSYINILEKQVKELKQENADLKATSDHNVLSAQKWKDKYETDISASQAPQEPHAPPPPSPQAPSKASRSMPPPPPRKSALKSLKDVRLPREARGEDDDTLSVASSVTSRAMRVAQESGW